MTFQTPIDACSYALQNHPGDIVEIGGGYGETTNELLKLAKKYKRKVYVIDPFESGWAEMPESYGKPYPLEKFLTNTKEYSEWLTLHRRSSQCITSVMLCERLNIAFAYVDGLQYHASVMHDLNMTGKAYIQCIDDMDRDTGTSQVPFAADKYARQTGKLLTVSTRWGFIR